MNYQKQRYDRGKQIRVSSVDRIGEPYRPPPINKQNHKEVFYEKEDVNDDDSLGSIKLYDLSNINDSSMNAQQRNVDHRISIRSDVGAPIPLDYRKSHQNLSNVRYTKQEEGVKKSIPVMDERITNTAKKMNTIINKQKNDNKRQLKVIITATDDQDVVRVCKSLIREYNTDNNQVGTEAGMVFFVVLIVCLTTLFYFGSSE